MLSNVLVIDDDEETRKLFSTVLTDAGYLVEAVENGKQAIKICKQGPFDIALIDIELPDITGTELLKTLRQLQPKMVKIIITGHPSIENAVKSVNEKADGYLLKPVNMAEMLEMIKKILAEKTNEYVQMMKSIEQAKESTPQFKYQNPDGWRG
ncbi:MAG: response regulator [Candidatus Bathyarchaeia archaeon]|jgi:DNA-binding NtrC family response regulator